MEFNRLLSSASVYGEPDLDSIKNEIKISHKDEKINRKSYQLIEK